MPGPSDAPLVLIHGAHGLGRPLSGPAGFDRDRDSSHESDTCNLKPGQAGLPVSDNDRHDPPAAGATSLKANLALGLAASGGPRAWPEGLPGPAPLQAAGGLSEDSDMST
jgi:hypothetical protein